MRTNSHGIAWAYQDAVVGTTVRVETKVETFIGKVTHRYEGDCGVVVRTNLEITTPSGRARSFTIWSDSEDECKVTVLNQQNRDARGRFIKRVETSVDSLSS